MQEIVSIEKTSDTECRVEIRVPPHIVDQKFTEFFGMIKPQAHVPGFRKGKAPVNRLRQIFGDKAKTSVAQALIGEYYSQAIKDSDISPVGNPTFSGSNHDSEYLGKFGFDNSYEIDIDIEILPDIDPIGYKNISLEFPECALEDICDRKINEYRTQYAERERVTDRGAEFGDSVVMDFQGFINDEPMSGGTAQNYSIAELGEGGLVPGFEEQLIGMKTGDTKIIYITFPINYNVSHLAGVDAKFDVKVNSVVSVRLADIDDDLAMIVGFETVEEMTENAKEIAQEEQKSMHKSMLDRQIFTQLITENIFNVPKSMLDDEITQIIKRNGLPENARDQVRSAAEFNVKRALLLDAIYNKEDDIEVDPNELDKALEEQAQQNNQTKDDIVSNLYNSGQMDAFMAMLRNGKVVDYIIDNAISKESEEKDE